MKKILVVLTILVLVAGFAFADISGKVSAEYGIGFFNALYEDADGNWQVYDATSTTYKPTSKQLLATVTLDKQIGGKTGEVTPYVDLKITAEFTRIYEDSKKYYASDANRPANKFSLSVDTFAIVGEEWSVNLLKAEGAKLDLAKSAIDSVTYNRDCLDENTQSMSMAKDLSYAKGISVTYKGFVAGLGFTTPDLKNKNAAITVEVATPEFAFGDVKVQGGIGFSQTGYEKVDATYNYAKVANMFSFENGVYMPIYNRTVNTPEYYKEGGVKVVAGSAKVAYDAEAVKASVAADFSKASDKNEAKFDLAANVEVAPVTVDVYYGNYVQTKSSKKPETVVTAENLLSAKVVFDVAKLAEDVPVKVTITGNDLLNRYDNTDDARGEGVWYISYIGKDYGKIVDVEVNTTALKNFDITATAGDLFNKDATYGEVDVKYTGIENVELEADVSYVFKSKVCDLALSAKYEAEKYTVEGGVEVLTDFEETLLFIDASIESDKLVDGATLKAAYGNIIGYTLDSLKNGISLGGLTLSCTVEF